MSRPQDEQDTKSQAGPVPPKPTDTDSLLTELNRTPLFMTSLDETDGSGNSNAHLDALKALAYEGTKAEVAENFKNQGNDCVKSKKWIDAREFYTQGLDVLRGKVKGRSHPSAQDAPDSGQAAPGELVDWGADESGRVVDLEEEERKERVLEEVLRVNRARVALEMKNYGSTVRDCVRTLKLNPGNTKAYYRSALALLALDKLKPALSAIQIGGAQIASDDTATQETFNSLRERIETRQAYLSRLETEYKQREEKKRLEATTLTTALSQRGINPTRSPSTDPPNLEDATIHLEDATDANSELSTPVLLLYPTVGQSELVKQVQESSTMSDVLSMVLPVPWDNSSTPLDDRFGGSDGKSVDCFVETAASEGQQSRLRKVGKRVRWGDVIKDGGAQVKDGLVRVYVVPRAKVDGWVGEWKKMNGR